MSHLGITHIDEGALRYMVEQFGVRTMVDVGCGPGEQVFLARRLGLQALGIDRDTAVAPDVVHDFRDGPLVLGGDSEDYDSCLCTPAYNLGWCVEFLEHLPESALQNVWPTLRQCRSLVVTAAPPGHGGVGHVNEQPWAYWRDLFEQQGFVVGQVDTAELRKASSMERDFIRERGHVLVRSEEW